MILYFWKCFLNFDVWVLDFCFLPQIRIQYIEIFQGTNVQDILRFLNFPAKNIPDFKGLTPNMLVILFVLPPEGLESCGRLVRTISTHVRQSPW